MNLSSLDLRSLKTRAVLFVLIVLVAGIWSLSVYASRMLRFDMERLLGQQQMAAVSAVADATDNELRERKDGLQSVAARITPAMLVDAPALLKFLDDRPILMSMFNGGLIVLDGQGTALADAPQLPGRLGINHIDVDSVAAALHEGKATVGRAVVGRAQAGLAFGMATPIRDPGGQVIGALYGLTHLDKPNFLHRIAASRYGNSGGYFLVDLEQRLLLAATDKARVLQPLPEPGVNSVIDRFVNGFEGSATFVNPVGVEVLTSFKLVPAARWAVAASLPAQEAFEPIRAMQQRILLATIVLTLLSGGAAWWMLTRQLSPMGDAVRTLAEMERSGQPLQPLPIARDDEIGRLVGGFNRLLAALAQREGALERNEAFARAIIEASPVPMGLSNRAGHTTLLNQAFVRALGYTLDDIPTLKAWWRSAIPDAACRHAAAVRWKANLDQAVRTGNPFVPTELELRAKDGRVRTFMGSVERLIDQASRTHVFVLYDITERKRVEEQLRLAASVFSHAREGIMITDLVGTIVDVNGAFSTITGYGRDDVVGRNPRILGSGRHDASYYTAMWSGLLDKGHWYGEIWNRRKSGEVYAEMQTISTVRDEQGRPQHFVSLFSDITSQKAHEKQLEHVAHYDALTGLPNRVLLSDRMQQGMHQAQRHGQMLAVAFLDLDGFKAVNDTHGHDVGDRLLVALASRMRHALREGDTLARLGGDEFVAVLTDLPDIEASVPLLTRVLAAAAQPVVIDEIELHVSASLGVAYFPQADDLDADQLLRQADQAMYQAKLAGKNRYHLFDAEQDRGVRTRHESLDRIRTALLAREFVLHYQPKVNMRTGTTEGVEALIRWQHPSAGLLLPAMFLPVIENHPLAVELGEWVFETALAQLDRWREDGLELALSVNVSARHLQQSGFVDRLCERLAAHPGLRPGDLQLEVLETSALEDLDQTAAIIEACRQMGVLFALDDFGTGYSSLTYLKRLAVAQLKIDQSFVRDMLDDPDDLAILEGVLGLATAFRRGVIAEGVETIEQGELLLQLGCELAQGRCIAWPMAAHELPRWLASWQPDPAWLGRTAASRDDLPLLVASVEHRAWVKAMASYLNGQRSAPPSLNPHECRFGVWLDTEGGAHHGARPEFRTIHALHLQVHALAATMCELHGDGNSAQALAKLDELHGLRDALIGQLRMVARDSGHA